MGIPFDIWASAFDIRFFGIAQAVSPLYCAMFGEVCEGDVAFQDTSKKRVTSSRKIAKECSEYFSFQKDVSLFPLHFATEKGGQKRMEDQRMPSGRRSKDSIRRLRYKKGDLIMKEGDYGISIYRVIRGEVQIYNEVDGRQIPLATLGPGEVIGEMGFLARSPEPRSASARAIEDSQLEAMHPALLAKEYEQMAPVLKFITDQALKRLIRMNEWLGLLGLKREEAAEKRREGRAGCQRLHYRKRLDLECTYRARQESPAFPLIGTIRDLSLCGVRLEISAKNARKLPLSPEREFIIEAVLPDGKSVAFVARVVRVKEAHGKPGHLSAGMAITNINVGSRRNLGFFLMP